MGDISDPEIFGQISVRDLAGILVLSSDNDANIAALKNIKEYAVNIKGLDLENTYCMARASDVISKQEMEALGADQVFMPSRLVSRSLLRSIEKAESIRRGHKLSRWFKDMSGKRLAIVVHDNPDPDAISSALALQHIGDSFDVTSSILYHGEIGHQENKAFVNLLGIDLNRMEELDLMDFDSIAMVDCAVPGANNMLSPGTQLGVVIDHHPMGEVEVNADYLDVRPNVGASATILTKYLQELNLDINKELATALLYGIRTDTLDFKRNTDSADLSAAAYLYPLSDHDILDRLERPSMSIETLDILGEAIINRQVTGSYLVTNVGAVRDRDALPQAADYLLNLEGVSTTIVIGVSDEVIYISGRSNDIRINLGEILRKAFGEEAAGGHSNAAGAQIPLGLFSDTKDRQTLLRLVNETVVRKFFNAVGLEDDQE